MKQFDVFNGDADGICALQQMRLASPAKTELITGIKRDIGLVAKVDAKAGDEILILDVSLAKNTAAVNRLLDSGCRLQYFDHHLAGDMPQHDAFEAHINTAADMCTSLLVNEYLNGQHVLWAIAGAYGDNMTASADRLADSEKLTADQKSQLKKLGIYLNYNGYGASLDDLHFKPDELYLALKPYASPFDFIVQEPAFSTLQAGYLSDMKQAECLQPFEATDSAALFILPGEKWCRRVSGVLGNDLSNRFPQRAHALLTELAGGGYQVSVRAPQVNKAGAGTLCSQFESGGGREGAAGINHLAVEDKQRFIDAFVQQYAAPG